MYSLNIDEVDKKIAEAKTSEEANFGRIFWIRLCNIIKEKTID